MAAEPRSKQALAEIARYAIRLYALSELETFDVAAAMLTQVAPPGATVGTTVFADLQRLRALLERYYFPPEAPP